jgi:alkyl sulfatase BDS1-like metallo-beta-lactamase superfamily hydrolase
VIQRYLGFWDCNPAALIPLSPEHYVPLYVEMMGGAERIMARGRGLHDEAQYLLAQETANKLVQAEPQNQAAKDLLADIFEQIGYRQENPGLRNSFLSGAYELRTGIPQGEAVSSSSPDVVRAMTTELFLNILVELENATLTDIAGFQAKDSDLTLTINRSDLEQTMMDSKTLEAQITDGTQRSKAMFRCWQSWPRPWSASIRASR